MMLHIYQILKSNLIINNQMENKVEVKEERPSFGQILKFGMNLNI